MLEFFNRWYIVSTSVMKTETQGSKMKTGGTHMLVPDWSFLLKSPAAKEFVNKLSKEKKLNLDNDHGNRIIDRLSAPDFAGRCENDIGRGETSGQMAEDSPSQSPNGKNRRKKMKILKKKKKF